MTDGLDVEREALIKELAGVLYHWAYAVSNLKQDWCDDLARDLIEFGWTNETGPELTSLPQRIRYAAQVVDETNDRFRQANHYSTTVGPRVVPGFAPMWNGASLRSYASQIQAEDNTATANAALVQQLGRELFDATGYPGDYEEYRAGYEHIANTIITVGRWTKGRAS